MKKLTMTQRANILREWHAETVDDVEMNWLNFNFEDMADLIDCAVRINENQRNYTPDDSWIFRQDSGVKA